MNIGEMDKPASLLEFTEAAPGRYGWAAKKSLWAKVEYPAAGSIFSKFGVTARSAKLTVHSDPGLTLHNALALPGGRHLFLVDINPDVPGFYVVSAAIVGLVECQAERTAIGKDANNRPATERLPPLIFQGCLAEKYLRQAQGEPMSHTEARYVLVTPKAIEIQAGALVEVAGLDYEVAIPHTLDPYKNEYEILRRADN
jgi:hypothetical protein